jgi:hypothetical protein
MFYINDLRSKYFETKFRVGLCNWKKKLRYYMCGSVHHQSILINNQRDEALSSLIYYSLRDYSTCFGCFLHPLSGVQLKL